MAIITKPATINKGTSYSFTLDKAALALNSVVSSDSYFQSASTWKYVVVKYKSSTRDQKEQVIFDASEVTPAGEFKVSAYFDGDANVQEMLIKDFDGGSLVIPRASLTEANFDIVFGA